MKKGMMKSRFNANQRYWYGRGKFAFFLGKKVESKRFNHRIQLPMFVAELQTNSMHEMSLVFDDKTSVQTAFRCSK